MRPLFKLLLVLVVGVLLVLCKNIANGQYINKPFKLAGQQATTFSDTNRFTIDFAVSPYFKNNEFFKNRLPGKTITGLQFWPQASYNNINGLKTTVGIWANKPFAQSNNIEWRPTITVAYNLKKWTFVAGTLKGGLNHNLIEPLFNFENALSIPLEEGLQALYKGQNLQFDIWLDWQQQYNKTDTLQEHFNFGITMFDTILNHRNFKIWQEAMLTIRHQGGQDLNTNLPVISYNQMAYGIGLAYKFNKNYSFFSKNYLVFNSYSAPKDLFPDTKNPSIYLNAGLETKWINLMISYWQAKDYYSFIGDPIFSSTSYSQTHPLAYHSEKNILILRFYKNFKITTKGYITVRVEPVFDFNENIWEFSHGFFINYTKTIMNK